MLRSACLTALLALVCGGLPCYTVAHLSHARAPPPLAAPDTREDDCRLRQFTLSYVDFLAQSTVTGNWSRSAYDALQLDDCSFVQQPHDTQPLNAPQWTELEKERLSVHNALDGAPYASCQWEVFVSPDGSDDDVGDIASPLQSIHRALHLSRQLPRPTPYTYSATSPLACITLRAGTYYLGYNASAVNTAYDSRVGAIHLTAADSGLTIRAMEGESITLSGGVPLAPKWQPWRNGSYSAPLSDSTIPALDRWHFNELYVNNQRAVRAKYPNGDPAIHGLWDNTGWSGQAKAWSPPTNYPSAIDVAISSPQRPGHFPTYQMGIAGPAAVFDPPQSFWATDNPPAGAKYVVPSGLTLDDGTLNRSLGWSDPLDGPAYVFAFHDGHWGSWAFEVANYSNVTGEVTFGRGGFQEARGSSSGAEWYISNILEELDAENEFYISYSSNTLYYQPNTSTTTDATTYIASQLPCILSIQGTSTTPVTDISIVGITFAHTASTFLRPYEVPSGGDWSVHRGGAVFIDNSANVLVTHSTFTQLGGNGIVFSNYNMAPTVIFSEFVWLGESAIVLLGTVSGIDGVTNTQQPTSTFLVMNLIHELGAYIKQTAGIVQFLSRKSYIGKSAIFNVPRAGININDGFAGGLSIEGNVIFNTVRETSDHGPINTWDREPYLVDYGAGPTLTPERNYITANLLLNGYSSVWPLDHDDGSCYYTDSYNVLIYGGYKNYLGHSKTAHNQLYLFPDGQRFDSMPAFAEKRKAAEYGGGVGLGDAGGAQCAQFFAPMVNDSGWDERYYNNTCLMQSSPNIYSYPEACDATTPAFQSVMPLLANNTFYTPTATPFQLTCLVNGTSQQLDFGEWQALGQDVGSVLVKATASTLGKLLVKAAEMLGMGSSSVSQVRGE